MKVGILAGGRGTRIASETDILPKPMVEIGGKPLLWHIMERYADFGHNEFVVACGYKADYIKGWFAGALESGRNVHLNFDTGESTSLASLDEVDWKVDLIDTGLDTGTGGRIKRLHPFLGDETCMVTWGDGLSDIDLDELLDFHRGHGRLATLTAVRPPARFGQLELKGEEVVSFAEKPANADGWINGAFFVFEPEVFRYIDGDETMFEQEPLTRLAADGQLMAYRHEGFWQCMDDLSDKRRLEKLWSEGAPWRTPRER